MDLQNRIVGIVGRKGSGKSTAARRVLEWLPRVLVYDPMGEHVWLPNRFRDLADMEEFLAWASTQATFAGSYVPERMDEEDFATLCDSIYDYGRMTFAVEEVPMLCAPGYLPAEFDSIVRLGRHHRVNVLWTAQRMAEVARRLTAATDIFILFCHTEPRDLDAVAGRCGREVAGKVARLGLHDCLVWDVLGRAEIKREAVAAALRGLSPAVGIHAG